MTQNQLKIVTLSPMNIYPFTTWKRHIRMCFGCTATETECEQGKEPKLHFIIKSLLLL